MASLARVANGWPAGLAALWRAILSRPFWRAPAPKEFSGAAPKPMGGPAPRKARESGARRPKKYAAPIGSRRASAGLARHSPVLRIGAWRATRLDGALGLGAGSRDSRRGFFRARRPEGGSGASGPGGSLQLSARRRLAPAFREKTALKVLGKSGKERPLNKIVSIRNPRYPKTLAEAKATRARSL
jgi:hypothetical protein